MSGGPKLSRWREAAIGALLAAPTIREAAAAAGVSEATLRRWLGDPAFERAYRAARRRVVEGAVGRLQAAAGEAVETLRRNLGCGAPSVEVRAALGVLDLALRGVELVDLEERVEALEARKATTAAEPWAGSGGRP